MTTARDLAIVALDVSRRRPLEQGDLSLALAGAEVLDLIEARVLILDGDSLVPGPETPTGDRLLDEAASLLVRRRPYESVEDWLWRRGRGLASAYTADLERLGLAARPRGRRIPLRTGRTVPVESPARRRAEERRASGEPVFDALAAAAGIQERPDEAFADLADETATAVLAAVGEAVMELEAQRQRRAIENAAFDNIWRGQ
ncbi:GOLPH3/VPS74 family protein [Streptomyces sp. MS06]|uniref:GOLPH3/VPS74 family protein n=1 Tax=Streptomyces sp. MS06 TaxID=3385974 RepID=UPI0039A0B4E8